MANKHMSNTEEREYLCGLKCFFQELDSAEKTMGLLYGVVGGLALDAWSGEMYEPERSNGTMKDIDVLVFDDPCNSIKGIEKRLRACGFKLSVDFSRAKSENYRSRVQLFSQLKRTREGYSLVFRGVERPLSKKACQLYSANLVTLIGTIPIRTFHPSILLHRYIIRVGGLKEKDRQKVAAFARHCVRLAGSDRFLSGHADYRIFHEFARNVREKYPWYARCLRAYNYIDHQVFNSLLSHRLIPRFAFRFLLNL